MIEPFSIAIPISAVDKLKKKLDLISLPVLGTHNKNYGPSQEDIRRLTDLWHDFDWRVAEARLNEFPHYLATLEMGEAVHKVHYIHKCGGGIPILLVHGWPGCFLEMTRLIEPLVTAGYDVIVPSLLNYGFSTTSLGVDVTIEDNADVFDDLMQTLGYDQYVVHGGDKGYLVARAMARRHINHCKAIHLNNAAPNGTTTPTIEDMPGLAKSAELSERGDGYLKLASTKPATIGFALSDSPVALLAWLYEKMHDWSDNYPWTDDEILTWVSIHWFASAGPDAALYYYTKIIEQLELSKPYCDVPIGISRFEQDILLLPKEWHQSLGPIVFWRVHEIGGHFPAWEKPDIVVEDLKEMLGELGLATSK